jgi:general stress protein YciG
MRRSEIAAMGGLAAQASGKAHRFTLEESRAAGIKGGTILAKDRAYMARIGRAGGLKSVESRRLRKIAVSAQQKDGADHG